MGPVTDFGRKVLDGKLQPVLMTKPAKPEVAKSVSCKCKVSICMKSCTSARANTPCCVSCLCLGSKDSGRVTDDDTDSEDEYFFE